MDLGGCIGNSSGDRGIAGFDRDVFRDDRGTTTSDGMGSSSKYMQWPARPSVAGAAASVAMDATVFSLAPASSTAAVETAPPTLPVVLVSAIGTSPACRRRCYTGDRDDPRDRSGAGSGHADGQSDDLVNFARATATSGQGSCTPSVTMMVPTMAVAPVLSRKS